MSSLEKSNQLTKLKVIKKHLKKQKANKWLLHNPIVSFTEHSKQMQYKA